MAMLPHDATFEEYCEDKRSREPDISMESLKEGWAFREKTLSLQMYSFEGERSILPKEEQDMTLKEREKKIISDAKAAGRDPVYVGSRWT
tara:strand:+ start:160 stop:429 length:270 start_codon:yes stop_codon:yes gene_type:complete